MDIYTEQKMDSNMGMFGKNKRTILLKNVGVMIESCLKQEVNSEKKKKNNIRFDQNKFSLIIVVLHDPILNTKINLLHTFVFWKLC